MVALKVEKAKKEERERERERRGVVGCCIVKPLMQMQTQRLSWRRRRFGFCRRRLSEEMQENRKLEQKLQVDALKWTDVWNLFKTGSQTDRLID